MRVHYIVINRLMQRFQHELIMNIRDVTGRVIMHPKMKIWFYVTLLHQYVVEMTCVLVAMEI
jgi:hypothetical protein